MNKKCRRAIIAGNWKMNMLASQARGFVEDLKPLLPETPDCGVAVCAPFVIIPTLICVPACNISTAAKAFKDLHISVGAENVYFEEKGAYTGEVSCAQLKDLDTKYVILGHSERREYNGETDSGVNVKAAAVLALDMTPIICVGESISVRRGGLLRQWLEAQLYESLSFWDNQQEIVVAYEPVWAIGTKQAATTADAQEACGYIRQILRERAGDIADDIRILYGGGVTPENISGLLICDDVDGALVGGSSLDAAAFDKIVMAAVE